MASLVVGSFAALATTMMTATAARSQAAPATVRVEAGELQGVVVDGVEAFKEHRCFRGQSGQRHDFRVSAGGVSVHSMLASPLARGLFHKAIVQSGGSRDSVLTARPMRKDGVDPNYPVSAETIGIQFAKSMGIEGTDQDALVKLRSLSAEQVLGRRSDLRSTAGRPVRPTA